MHGDIGPFDHFGPRFDLLVPSVRASTLRAALVLAEGPVRRGLHIGGGPTSAIRHLDLDERIAVADTPGSARRAQGAGFEVVVGDPAMLPVRTGSVDAVLVVDVLHHLANVEGVLNEARGVLRPGGVLVVREFDPATLRGGALAIAERLVGLDSAFLRPDDLAGRMARAGLSPTVVERGVGYTVAGVVESGEAKYRGSQAKI